MSTLGKKMSLATREKMRQRKIRIPDTDLIQAARQYFIDSQNSPDTLPSIAKLCLKLKVNKEYIKDRARDNTELADIIDQINLLQEAYLLQKADQTKNPTFQIFMLKVKHDYKETPTQLTQNNNFNISPDLLADALALMKKPEKPE